MATIGYIMHDPIGNVEGVVTDYTPDILKLAEERGMIFIAVDENGDRAVAKAADVKMPESQKGEVTLVLPEYVDTRMTAVLEVFYAISEILVEPAESFASVDDEAEHADPIQNFLNALCALKKVLTESEETSDGA